MKIRIYYDKQVYITRLKMKIKELMTLAPYTVDGTLPIQEVLNQMNLRNVEHMPVTENSQLIGIISKREATIAVSLINSSQIGLELRANQVCSQSVYLVSVDEDLAKVCREMSEKNIDCTLVADGECFVGTFTSKDACHLIHLLLDKSSGLLKEAFK